MEFDFFPSLNPQSTSLAAMVLFWKVQWQGFLIDDKRIQGMKKKQKIVQYINIVLPFDGLCLLCRTFVQMDVFVKNDPQIAGKPSKFSCHYYFRKLRTSKLVGS